MKIDCLDNGYVKLRNISGPTRRSMDFFDANDIDPANSARFSFDGADKDRTKEQDIKLSKYLLTNHHTTPFEMIEVWLEMKLPLFVARQFVRHRTVSINEVSARYTVLPKEFYIPDPTIVGVKSKNNKQGRSIGKEQLNSSPRFVTRLRDHCEKSYSLYRDSLNDGIPPEIARISLPVNIYTKWLWNQDLHNLLHFIKLRRHEHAQYEARVYADSIHRLLSTVLPETIKIFDEMD